MAADRSYVEAVSAWSAHLRAGGTTAWSAWREAGIPNRPPVTLRRPVPDAIHLELIRRINLADRQETQSVSELADRVLATGAPGRGLLDVPLPWPAAPRRFGTPAIEPERVPEEELIRLAVGVLAHLLPEVPRPVPDDLPSPWPMPWRRRFRLHGSPGTVSAVRRDLLDQGMVETDWRPVHVVIARPVEVMMAEHWADSVRNGGILKWSTVWRRAEAAGRLPAPIDVATIAHRLHDRLHEPLHIVVAREADEAAALAADVLHARPATIRRRDDPAHSDLLRRLNRLTALTQGPRLVRESSSKLVAILDEESAGTPEWPPPATPPASLPWADEVAVSCAEAIRHADYAVHGDPDALAPNAQRLQGAVDRERTLELAVGACLRAWHRRGNP